MKTLTTLSLIGALALSTTAFADGSTPSPEPTTPSASKQSDDATQAKQDAIVNAAKTCKAERTADPAAFREKYGTNKNKRNAFGKCVSKTTKENEVQAQA